MPAIKNRIYFLVFTVMLLFFSSCFSQKLISKPLPNNPTSYIFKIKIEDAARILEKACYSRDTKESSKNKHIILNYEYTIK
jgi:hypothetical protein